MEYQATSKYLRISTRKVRLVVDAIKSLPIAQAQVQLSMMPKRGALFVKKTLDSAIANAKAKNVAVEQLTIARIEVMGGPMMKRFHAVSRGMAHSYKKRMTHVRVVLADGMTTTPIKEEKVKEEPKTKEPKGSKDQSGSKKKKNG